MYSYYDKLPFQPWYFLINISVAKGNLARNDSIFICRSWNVIFISFQNVEDLVNENALLKEQIEIMEETGVCDSFKFKVYRHLGRLCCYTLKTRGMWLERLHSQTFLCCPFFREWRSWKMKMECWRKKWTFCKNLR